MSQKMAGCETSFSRMVVRVEMRETQTREEEELPAYQIGAAREGIAALQLPDPS